MLFQRPVRNGLLPPERKTSLNDQILKAIDEEIARLREARTLLAGSGSSIGGKKTAASGASPRRKLSAKARRAIADAQRRRWAKVKSQKKSAATTAAS